MRAARKREHPGVRRWRGLAARRSTADVVLALYGPMARRLMRGDRRCRRRGLRLAVPRGVFHPGLFFSTIALDDELSATEVAGRTVLDVGTGSGFLALRAARRGGRVTAVDVNPAAVGAARANAVATGLDGTVEVVESDLFDALGGRRFDVVVANPPYFPSDPRTPADRAFHAGADFDWFRRFFAGLGDHVRPGSSVLMVLGGHCDLTAIGAVAAASGWALTLRRTAHRRLAPQLVLAVEPLDRPPASDGPGAARATPAAPAP
jgi:release factor glutamine methyltransferase